jgi:hypothetical protein
MPPATIKHPVTALIQTAREFLGVREQPGNRGIVPDFANWWVGRDMRDYPMGLKGAPWCSTWANLMGRLALGWAWPVPVGPEFSDVDRMVLWAKQNDVWYTTPHEGDLFCVKKGDGYGHIGIVVLVQSPEQIRTLEGNTNNDGSFNGNGVYERTRAVSTCGFIRWVEVPRWAE